ncbi:response regulator transcription factor [Extibacter muris]|uniref:response regulator transcription factor n=1 Tax=Extibacter muris TaxID=1796622 RepID=UPI001D069A62|nr:response regulator [Extibacter muris]MCB6203241.1 response regulator [Extibacter muris]MCQ4664837.1 response regulator [Extibacter muris]MCQ4694846.1 response regulator [Extibacter muris]
MLKVLIVDDEVQICELIRSFLIEMDMELEIMGQAYSGRSALKLIEEGHPDVVISDIRMPGIDGLELVKKVQDLSVDVTFILVSGHKEFEYAYSAIKYGVEYYMLKPINEQELHRNIRLIAQKRDQNCHDRQKVDMAVRKSKEFFLKDLTREPEKIRTMRIEELRDRYSLDLEYKYHRLCILKPDLKYELDEKQKRIILQQMEDFIAEMNESKGFHIDSYTMKTQILSLLGYDDAGKAHAYLEQMLSKIHNRYYEYYNITLALGPETDSENRLDYRLAAEAAITRLAVGSNRIIYWDTSGDGQKALKMDEEIKNLKKAIEIIDEDLAKEALVPFKKRLLSIADSPVSQLAFLMDVSADIIEYMNMMCQEEDGMLQTDEWNIRFYNCGTRLKLYTEFNTMVIEGIRRLRKEQDAKDNHYVRTAKKYVQEHYWETISLDDMAGITYVNAAYFSALFKKQEGMNFSEYVTQFRVNMGKELLKDGRISIAEVGQRIGYKNPKYFSKVFTKQVGIKPSEYRKLFL